MLQLLLAPPPPRVPLSLWLFSRVSCCLRTRQASAGPARGGGASLPLSAGRPGCPGGPALAQCAQPGRDAAATCRPVLAPLRCSWLSTSANPFTPGLAGCQPLQGGARGRGVCAGREPGSVRPGLPGLCSRSLQGWGEARLVLPLPPPTRRPELQTPSQGNPSEDRWARRHQGAAPVPLLSPPCSPHGLAHEPTPDAAV